MKFSVLMSVYINDDSTSLDGAINSVLVDQSLKPNQLVIVKDGQLNKGCDEILNKWQSNDLVKIINIDVNIGLGDALNEGLKHCNYNLVARMDSDDICDSNRFKTQITEFINDDDILLLSHTVTPEIDSVPILKKYSQEQGVVDSKWNMVTGDKKQIYDLARKSYLVAEDIESPVKYDMIHTENFVLVDSKRRIRGFYDGTDIDVMEDLINDIKILKKEDSD